MYLLIILLAVYAIILLLAVSISKRSVIYYILKVIPVVAMYNIALWFVCKLHLYGWLELIAEILLIISAMLIIIYCTHAFKESKVDLA